MKTKRLTALLISVLMILQMFAVTVSAGQYDDVFADFSFTEFANYEDTLDETLLRAFTVDPNGKYYYGGFLNTGGIPTVYQFDASTGNEISTYQFDPEEDPGAYIKALAADDRGYVYMGVANAANDGAVYFAICSQDGLNEIKWVKIEIEGKVGVNGAAVRQFGDKYYLYIVTNYDTDRLYCYDVTDVKNPVLNTDFGSNAVGYIDLYSAFDMTDANNIAVDEAGFLYICANTGNGSKGDTVFKVALEDMSIVAQASISECFGITLLDNGYLAVCTYESTDSKVYILNQQDLTTVKVVSYENASNFTQLGVIGNQIYMSGQNPDAVFVSTAMPWGTCGENVTWTLVDGVLTISGTGDMYDYDHAEWNYYSNREPAPWYGKSVSKIVVENGVTSIGTFAFACMDVAEIIIPSSVRVVGIFAFANNYTIQSMVFPEGVVELQSNLFTNTRIKSISIPSTVEILDTLPLDSNTLEVIVISDENPYFTIVDGIVYNADGTELIYCVPQKSGTVIIPDSVSKIRHGAFNYGIADDIQFTNHITDFGSQVFWSSSVKILELPEGVVKLDSDIGWCHNLETLILPSTLKSIDSGSIRNNQNLKSVYFLGDAPAETDVYGTINTLKNNHADLTLYYFEGTEGWTEGTWTYYGMEFHTVKLPVGTDIPITPTQTNHGNAAYVSSDSITIDGSKDDAYANIAPIAVKFENGKAVADMTDGNANVYLATNNGLLYVYAEINDTEIVIPAEDQQKNSPWATDSLEMFIHADQIYQFRVDNSGYPSFYMNQNGDISAYGPDAVKDYFVSYAKGAKDGGYTVEFCIDLKNFGVSSGTDLGINFQLNDRANDGSQRTIYNGVSGSWDAHLYDTITVGAGESYESVTKPSVPAPEEPTPDTPTTAIGIPFVEAGAITTDAQKDAAYDNAVAFDIATPLGGASGSASAKAYMMSNNGLMYLYVDVIDPEVNTPSVDMQKQQPWNTDSIEFLFQTHNDAFDDVHQFRVDVSGYASYFMNESGEVQGYGEAANTYFEDYAVRKTDTGYAVEMCIDMKQFGVSAHETIGIQMQLNDVLNANPTAVGAFYHLYGTEHAFNTGYYTTVYVGNGEDYDTTREPDIEVKPEGPGGRGLVYSALEATPVVDGVMDDVWQDAFWTDIDMPYDGILNSDCGVRAKILHDDELLYFLVEVKDATPTVGKDLGMGSQDQFEVYIDEDACKGVAYCNHCVQFGLLLDETIREGTNADGKANMIKEYKVGTSADSYILEFSVALQNGIPTAGRKIGLEFMYNDCDENGTFLEALRWNVDTANGDTAPWQAPECFGELICLEAVQPEVPSTGLDSRQNKNVVYATPEIDGVLSEGEWSSISSHVINADNAVAWAGETISEVVFHYAWDDEGFYLAADVEDEDVCLASGIEAVYNLDAVQIALDPAGLIGAAELGGGMFFSIGPMEDGALGAVYHPYGGAAEAFDYTGAYNVTDNGWQFEIMIPWTSIEILADDGYAWTHEANEVINALFCVLDRDADGENLYMSAIDELSFSPSDYPYALRLKPAKSTDSNRGNITQIDASAISVDGKMDDAAWADALVVDIDKHIIGNNDTHGMAHMLWSDDTLYIYYDIHDADVVPPSEDNQKNQPWNTDSVEMFLNFANSNDVHQFRIDCSGWLSYYLNASGDESIYGPDAKPYFGDYAVSMDADGYNIEAAINLEKWGLLVGDTIGFQLQINDVVSPDVNFTSEVIVIDSAKGAGSWDSHLYDYVVLADKDGGTTPVVPGRGLVYTSPFAVPTVDGVMDDAWQSAEWTEIDLPFDGSLDSVCAARAKVMHDKSLLYFLVEVEDATPTVGKELDLTLQDSIELHIDEDLCRRKAYCDNAVQFGLTLDGDIREGTNANGKSDMIREYVVGKNDNGYVLEFSVALKNGMPADGNKIGLEFMYNDCDENGTFLEALRWNADTANGDTPPWQGTRSFGELVIGYRTGEMLGTSIGEVPYIKPGSIEIDGQYSSVWENALKVDIDQFNYGDENASTRGTAYMYWTEGKWYLFVDVKDNDVVIPDAEKQANEPWVTDSVELFFDFGHAHSELVKQFRIDCSGYPSYYEEGGDVWAYGDKAKGYFDKYAVSKDADGYNIEMVINLEKFGLTYGDDIGLQLQINDVISADPTNVYSCWNMHQSMEAGSWDADLYDYITLEAPEVIKVEIPVTEDKETVSVKVEEAVVQGSTVTVNNVDTDALAKVFDTPAAAPDEGAGDTETKPAAPANTVTIDVSNVKSEGAAEAEKVQQVTIPAAVVGTIKTAAENNNVEDAKLAVHLTTGSIIIDKTTLDVINEAAKTEEGTTTTISLVIDDAEDNLNEVQEIALENTAKDEVVYGKLEVAMAVTKTDTASGASTTEKIHDFNGGTVQLEVPFEVPAGLKANGFTVYYLDEEGELHPMETQISNGKIIWTTGHFSDYIIMYKEPPKEPIKINVGELVDDLRGQMIDAGRDLYDTVVDAGRDLCNDVVEDIKSLVEDARRCVVNRVERKLEDLEKSLNSEIESIRNRLGFLIR